MSKSELVILAKWILIIPLAAIIYIFGYASVILLEKISSFFVFENELLSGILNKFMIPIAACFLSALLSITISTDFAPKKKKVVGLVLVVLYSSINGVLIYLSFRDSDLIGGLTSISTVLGAIYGYTFVDSDL